MCHNMIAIDTFQTVRCDRTYDRSKRNGYSEIKCNQWAYKYNSDKYSTFLLNRSTHSGEDAVEA